MAGGNISIIAVDVDCRQSAVVEVSNMIEQAAMPLWNTYDINVLQVTETQTLMR